MHATTVIGYSFDADIHCKDCTKKYINRAYPLVGWTDSEDNPIHPVFASDEWWNVEDDFCQTLNCGDCHTVIDTVHSDNCEYQFGDTQCTLID